MKTTWRHASTEGRVLIAAALGASAAALGWLVSTGRLLDAVLLVAGLLAAEIAAMAAARLLSKKDGIVAIDETPRITEAMLDRFFEHGFDPELGWIRKPNTTKKDLGKYPYRIDERGSRANPGHERLPLLISTYGDSYTFCREVEDHETWQWHLAEATGSNVLNFGVGNYGFDQALLRFEREYGANPTPIVVMAVVPSTLARILSVWKHYNEFGNLFAFKPRYVLEGDDLRLLPNPIDRREKFFALGEHLPAVQASDYFYGTRFQREALRPPYLVSSLVNWRGMLLGPAKAARRIAMRLRLDEAPFAAIIARLDGGSVRQVAALYAQAEPRRLLVRLAQEFAARVRARGAHPLVVFLPMKDDMFHMRRHGHFYDTAVREIARDVEVVDLAPALREAGPIPALYREWHYSPAANRIVGEVIARALQPLLAAVQRQKPRAANG